MTAFFDPAPSSEPPEPGAPLLAPFARPIRHLKVARRPSPFFPSISPRSDAFRCAVYPGTDISEWNDWRWQIRNMLRSEADLDRILELRSEERSALKVARLRLPFAVTPYAASLLWQRPAEHGLRKCLVPTDREFAVLGQDAVDPLGEEHDSPVPGLVHRYPNRVLLLATDFCSNYCRYCTRSRCVGVHEKHLSRNESWDQAVEYISRHSEVQDVLVSGGDPLTLPDTVLCSLLERLRAIPHVEILRIGTKTPMVLPQRITPRLVSLLKRFHPLFVSIHCTHPDELTPEAAQACARLANAGIPLGSQTVLLRGVNDDAEILARLFQGLLRFRVRPYYLYHCDPVMGASHFRTSVEKGVEIIRAVRGNISGYAVPHYVVDLPGGGGKTPVCPDYITAREGDDLVFTNFEGKRFRCFDPIHSEEGGRA